MVLGTLPLFSEINRYRIQEANYLQKVSDDHQAAAIHKPTVTELLGSPPEQGDEDDETPVVKSDPVLDEIGLKPEPVQYLPTLLAWAFGLALFALGRGVRYVLADE